MVRDGGNMGRIQTLVAGRGLVESPRWHGDRLYFSDWSAGEVLAVDAHGASEVVARVDALPLCTAWLPDDRLVIVSSTDGRLLRREPDGSLVVHADLGRPGWNDVVADGRGNVYVNGAGSNPMTGETFTPGAVVLATPDGRVRQVADDIALPNGMAVTPDGICLDAHNAVWYADVPHQRCVRVAQGGTVLHTVDLDRGGFACALGGPDGTTLFITAAR